MYILNNSNYKYCKKIFIDGYCCCCGFFVAGKESIKEANNQKQKICVHII